jgi:peptidoglycan/LPS O-acetylase OafA/YrhL
MTSAATPTLRQEAPIPSAGRIDSLTGLRFIAAGLVLMHHTLAPTILYRGVASIPGTRHFAVVGYVGVTTFFVLSGFVLAWSWDDRRSRTGFYGRRFARVWPLHALTWVAVVLVVAPLTDSAIGGHPATPAQNVAGLALVHGWIPNPTWYFAGNAPSWSLACEAFFYALLPFLVPLLRRWGRRAAVVTVIASTLFLAVVPLLVRGLGHDKYRLLTLSIFPAYRVGEFLVGVTLGWAIRNGWRPRWSLRQAVAAAVAGYVAAALLTGGLYFTSVTSDRALGNIYSDVIILLPAAGLIAALAAADLDGRPTWLARPIPVLLGGASFAFYLVHVSVIQFAGELPLRTRVELRGIPTLIAVVAVALAVAIALHVWVERPVERALRRRIEAHEGLPPQERVTSFVTAQETGTAQ